MVIAIVITSKVESKLLPKRTLCCQGSLASPKQETLRLLQEPDDEFAFPAGITGEACSDYSVTTF